MQRADGLALFLAVAAGAYVFFTYPLAREIHSLKRENAVIRDLVLDARYSETQAIDDLENLKQAIETKIKPMLVQVMMLQASQLGMVQACNDRVGEECVLMAVPVSFADYHQFCLDNNITCRVRIDRMSPES